MNRYPIKIGFYTKKAGKAHMFIPCADLIKNERGEYCGRT